MDPQNFPLSGKIVSLPATGSSVAKKTGQLLRGCKRTLQRWFRKNRSIAAIPVR